MDCFFCKVGSSEIKTEDIFFEDEKVFAMLDIDWAVKGHALVVRKDHALNMSDLSEQDFLHFSSVCQRVERELLRILGVGKSIALKSGGLQAHFHFHIYPVETSIAWETVRDIFEKKIKYTPEIGEKVLLLGDLRDALNNHQLPWT